MVEHKLSPYHLGGWSRRPWARERSHLEVILKKKKKKEEMSLKLPIKLTKNTCTRSIGNCWVRKSTCHAIMRTRVYISELTSKSYGTAILTYGSWRQGIPRASWLSSLADTAGFRFSERACLNTYKGEWWGKIPEASVWLLHTCSHEQMHCA